MVMASKTARFYHPSDRDRLSVSRSQSVSRSLYGRLPFCQQQIVMAVNLVPLSRAHSRSLSLSQADLGGLDVCPSGDPDSSRSLSGRECLND